MCRSCSKPRAAQTLVTWQRRITARAGKVPRLEETRRVEVKVSRCSALPSSTATAVSACVSRLTMSCSRAALASALTRPCHFRRHTLDTAHVPSFCNLFLAAAVAGGRRRAEGSSAAQRARGREGGRVGWLVHFTRERRKVKVDVGERGRTGVARARRHEARTVAGTRRGWGMFPRPWRSATSASRPLLDRRSRQKS